MEDSLNSCLLDLYENPAVHSVVCVDQRGLKLASAGNIKKKCPGGIAALMKGAEALDSSTPGTSPTIVLHTDKTDCIIQKQSNVITAVYKSK